MARAKAEDNPRADRGQYRSSWWALAADDQPLKLRDATGHYTESPPEMTSPMSLVNVASPPPNQPLIHVAPSLPTGPLVFTAGLNLPMPSITRVDGLDLSEPLIHVQGDRGPTIFSADSGKLRRNLERALGRPLGDDHQAHHLIPGELEKLPIVDRAIKAGWDIDSEENGMPLPNNRQTAEEEKLPLHSGPHRDYTRYVQRRLNILVRKDPSDSELPTEILNLSDELFDRLGQLGQKDPGSRLP